ncbi:hypothetical protein R6Q59_028580, partial [Mikania micrantha]
MFLICSMKPPSQKQRSKTTLYMGLQNAILNGFKKSIAFGLVGITVTDRYAGVCPIRGSSMSPTFNPSLGSFSDDYVFLEKFCLDKYRFSHGDVIIFRDPGNYKERCVKRIVGMEGDYISLATKVPQGHCWVQGDNSAFTTDSRTYGSKVEYEQFQKPTVFFHVYTSFSLDDDNSGSTTSTPAKSSEIRVDGEEASISSSDHTTPRIPPKATGSTPSANFPPSGDKSTVYS